MSSEEFFTIAGQIMLLVGIAGLLMQIGRWLQKRNIPKETSHFIVIVSVVVLMGVTTIILSTSQHDSLNAIEGELVANQRQIAKTVNATAANQLIEKQILRELHYHIVVQSPKNETTLLRQLQNLVAHHTNITGLHLLPPRQSVLNLSSYSYRQSTPQTT